MITMTSLNAQNHFGELLDTSQREPVMITRHGRPVSIVLSPNGDVRRALYEIMKAVGELSPLRGDEAVAELERVTKNIHAHNANSTLTEADVNRLIDAKK